MPVLSDRKVRTRETNKVIPSLALRRTVFGQALVYATHRQPAGTSTEWSTPRGRNWLGPPPILSGRFEGAGSTAPRRENAAGRTAAGGRQPGFLPLNLEKEVGDDNIGLWSI